MVLVESGLNSEQGPFALVLKQVVLITRMVLISDGLYWQTLLYICRRTGPMYDINSFLEMFLKARH